MSTEQSDKTATKRMSKKSEETNTPSATEDSEHLVESKQVALSDEEQLELLEARVECLERISGIPRRDAQFTEKLTQWLTYQINHKLAIFGSKLGCVFAVIVLLCNIAFVVGFSKWQASKCVPNMSIIDGDFDYWVYETLYKDPSNVFVCTTMYLADESSPFMAEFTTDDGDKVTCSNRVPCTLAGLTQEDYDPKLQVCPTSFGGCAPYQCVNQVTGEVVPPRVNEDSDSIGIVNREEGQPLYDNEFPWIPEYLACGSDQSEETFCTGPTSITYYICPTIGTVVGASLGYLFVVEIVAVLMVVSLYFLFTGRRYTFSDMRTAFAGPTGTLESARAARLSAAENSKEPASVKSGESDADVGTELHE